MKRPPRNRPARVAEQEGTVRTNVARAWHRAVARMGISANASSALASEGAAAKDAAIAQALSAQAAAEARLAAARVIETPMLWTLDATEAASAATHAQGAALVNAPAHALAMEAIEAAESLASTLQSVTLIVYGWSSVEPGTLAWVFPTVRAALAAARAMRNAIGWAILSGDHGAASGNPFDLAAARERGEILVEQPA